MCQGSWLAAPLSAFQHPPGAAELTPHAQQRVREAVDAIVYRYG